MSSWKSFAARTRSPRLPRSTTSPCSVAKRQRNFRARIGVGDRAAHRALVAGLEMADEGQGGGEQRKLFLQVRPGQQLVLCHRGADLDCVAEIADVPQFGDPRDVDQHRRVGQPQVHHRHQRLPAGEDARLVAMLGEQRHRLIHRVGPHVIERARLHRTPPFCAISAWMRRGVAGSCTSLTPSASAMALAMQAGTLMQLPSARPLAPSGVNGDGDSM